MNIFTLKLQLKRVAAATMLSGAIALVGSCTSDFDESSDDNSYVFDSELVDGEAIPESVLVSYEYDMADDMSEYYLNKTAAWKSGTSSTKTLATYPNCADSNNGKPYRSNQFTVEVQVDNSAWEEVDVLMSHGAQMTDSGHPIYWYYTSDQLGSGYPNIDSYRSFSFVTVSYNDLIGKRLRFRVTPIGDISSTSHDISPKYRGYSSSTDSGSVIVDVYSRNTYFSVDFTESGNKTTYDWIKHMLCIFVDPMEDSAPQLGDTGVVEFTAEATGEELSAASTIYFAAGKNYNFIDSSLISNKSLIIDDDGAMTVQDGQTVYVAGGAFIEGGLEKAGSSNDKWGYTVRGRGVMSGRRFGWKEEQYAAISQGELIHGGYGSVFEGIMIMDSPNHGINSSADCKINNVKMLGWHYNNDGFRPGENSYVANCFLRADDDFFYNYNLTVRDCLLWPKSNGSIVTFGWQGIDLGGSTLENIDIINVEWQSLGNNKGLIMSQNTPQFVTLEEYGPTIFNNIHFEGALPGFVNIHVDSDYSKSKRSDYATKNTDGTYSQYANSIDEIGWVGNVEMNNIYIYDGTGKSVIGGMMGAMYSSNGTDDATYCSNSTYTWWARDFKFNNVYISGTKLTKDNYTSYFTIYGDTAKNIYINDVEVAATDTTTP